MTTCRVDDTASGANDGSSWVDAWTSIASADGGATTAGGKVLIASAHREALAATINVVVVHE